MDRMNSYMHLFATKTITVLRHEYHFSFMAKFEVVLQRLGGIID